MDRREFSVSISGLVVSGFLASCKKQEPNLIQEVYKRQDKYFDLFNEGRIEDLADLLYKMDCSYLSDSQVGDLDHARRCLTIIYKRSKRSNKLPFKIIERKGREHKGMAWVTLQVGSNSGLTKHGSLTQVFYSQRGQWKIAHDHFSKAREK